MGESDIFFSTHPSSIRKGDLEKKVQECDLYDEFGERLIDPCLAWLSRMFDTFWRIFGVNRPACVTACLRAMFLRSAKRFFLC